MNERQRPESDAEFDDVEYEAEHEAEHDSRRESRSGSRRDRDRGRRRSAVQRARRAHRDEDEAPSRRVSPGKGLKRSVVHAIRQIPSYIRLLIGLIGDRRVSAVDRFIVIAAAAYIVSPLDFIPDVIPFLGQVDDIFLLILSLQRLIERAGDAVLLDHWRGDPAELDDLNLAAIVSAAGFFLPARMRRRLRKMAGR